MGAPGTAGISAGTKRAVVALLVLVLIVGGANLWGSWDQVHSFKEQLHAQQVAEQKAAAKEIGELCATFGKVAELKPPPGSQAQNPSRAYLQDEHADLARVVPDLGCSRH
jgi:hypothetical protein